MAATDELERPVTDRIQVAIVVATSGSVRPLRVAHPRPSAFSSAAFAGH